MSKKPVNFEKAYATLCVCEEEEVAWEWEKEEEFCFTGSCSCEKEYTLRPVSAIRLVQNNDDNNDDIEDEWD